MKIKERYTTHEFETWPAKQSTMYVWVESSDVTEHQLVKCQSHVCIYMRMRQMQSSSGL